MSDRFFLDTNIFVYSYDWSATRKANIAEQLIGKALVSRKGVVSFQVIQEFFNVSLKRFSPAMSLTEAEEFLSTVFRPLLSVHSSANLYSEALRLYGRNGLSWYDSLIVSSAIIANCDVLYSEDMQHGQRFGNLQILNPFL